MIRPDDPTAEPTFQIDSLRSPLFQILQPLVGSDRWAEVGYVWTYGTSRTDSTECWYLYDTVSPDTGLAPYSWPGYDASGRMQGGGFRLVPAAYPSGVDPTTMKAYLERTKGVSLTYIVGTMKAGR